MKAFSAFNLKRKYSLTEKIEFGISTFLLIIGLTGIITEEPTFYGELLGINYLYQILLLGFFYLSFLLLNFIVIPTIEDRKVLVRNIIILISIIAISFVFSAQFGDNVVLIGLSIYFFVKYSFLFLRRRFINFREEKGIFSTGILLALLFYLILMFSLVAGQADLVVMVLPGILIPFSICLYAFSWHKLLPVAVRKKHPVRNYLWKIFLVLLVSSIPLWVLAFLLTGDEDISLSMVILNIPIQYFVTVPLSWVVYKRYTSGKEEVHKLQKELGQSTAQFDFLRSQINPHFLFNALNTLYGTALQENAERTGEGIQKLGDMMRFMLHENMQEKIPLEREIEYLENYVNLQKLRTDPNPDIIIQEEIDHHVTPSMISPMLLIPFVENAFKHGISLREPSHIKIALEKRENFINFDVYNSKHEKQDRDPERNNNGIGLTNVRQRLELLYPEKHDLVIRDTKKEYFVHLSLDLS